MAPQGRPHPPMCAARVSPLATGKVIQGRVQKLRNGLLKVCVGRESLKIARQNQRESPFLRLPAELRNKIYSYVLGGKNYKSPFWQALESSQDKLLRDKESLSLLSVCRQIYKETSILPFQLNTFQFERQSDLSAWIKTLLPGQRDAIRALKYFGYIHYMLFIGPQYAYGKERFVGLKEFPSLERVHAYYIKGRGDSDDIAAKNDTTEKLIKESLANADIEVIFESPDG